MKLLNKCICLSSRKTLLILAILLISTLVLAGILYEPEHITESGVEPPIEQLEEVVEVIDSTNIWVPTEEDIAYQDSMYTIIQNTQNDITDIKEDIVYIIERLDYEDGTHDSIRYVKGGKIDKSRN